MNKKYYWYLLGGAALLALSAFLLPTETESTQELLVAPQQGNFQVTVTATGELQAKNSVKIYGPTGARQARIYEIKVLQLVPEGTVVTKGEFVAELDKSELNSRIQDTQIELQKAESQYTQTKLDTALTLSKARDELINLSYAMEEAKLRKEQAKFEPPSVQRQAEIDFEKAERAFLQKQENYKTEVQQGAAKMSEVEAELNKSQKNYQELLTLAQEFTIMAPENGMVIYKRDWNGQKLTAGGTMNAWDPVVATLPDLSVMESITYVNEVDIQKVKEGQPVQLGLDADPDKRMTGTVSRVANIGEQRPNSDAKVFEVAIVVNASDSTLRPAMTTSNTIVVAKVPDVMYIPIECIHTQDSLNFVYLKKDGRLIKQEVTVGLLNENEAIVKAGLSLEDEIYISIPPEAEEASLIALDGTLNMAAIKP